MDPIELLARDDKWYLGAGDAILFAPPFPLWLDRPGFWDEATVHQYAMGPVFTVTALDEDGRELPLRLESRRWTPAELTAEFQVGEHLTATEVRTVHPGGVFVSEWRLAAPRSVVVHLVAWTAYDASTTNLDTATWDGGALRLERALRDRRGTPLSLRAELACTAGATSWAAYVAARTASQPHWRLTPFVEKWHMEGLPRELRLDAAEREGLVYAAVHRAVGVGANGASATFAMRLVPTSLAESGAPPSASTAIRAATYGGASRRRWQELFASVPQLRCSDPYLETAYWYRWYGAFLNAVAPGAGRFEMPTMCEGIGPLHQPSARAAPAHVRELRWASGERARGVVRTFFAHQREDGAVPERVLVNALDADDPRQVNWGDAVLALDAACPDPAFLAELYPRLSRYAEWLVETRDADESGLLDADPAPASARVPPRPVREDQRLKGVDATTYGYVLFRALERIAPRVALSADARRWKMLGDRTAIAVRRAMWDPDAEMFFDVVPGTLVRTGVHTAACFLPFATDLATAQHLKSLEHHLVDPDQFWSVFPVPTLSLADPRFDPHGEWRGRRHAAPQNGRVWPHVNCQIADALGRVAVAYAPHLRPLLAQFLSRFVRMMFHNGDLGRPNVHEHYNPFSGQASLYRGIDDHQDSWVNDLILQYVLGIRPHESGITIDPFPFQLDYAEVTGARVRGCALGVRIEGERVIATVDGVPREGRLGTPMEVGR